GDVNLRGDVKETFNRLNLRNKYNCMVFSNPTKEQEGMIKKVSDLIAFGEITEETFKKLNEKRGNKKYPNFFRLHPPRKGLRSSKLHFPKGVLGNHGNKINELIEKML
ncbi:MAG: hypothetical protein WD876_02780, partial [Candidatus Pacearchaeota archaeon]